METLLLWIAVTGFAAADVWMFRQIVSDEREFRRRSERTMGK